MFFEVVTLSLGKFLARISSASLWVRLIRNILLSRGSTFMLPPRPLDECSLGLGREVSEDQEAELEVDLKATHFAFLCVLPVCTHVCMYCTT